MANSKPESEPGYAEALKRIEACRKSRATSLDLMSLGLSELPPEIGQLTALIELDV